MPRKTPRTPLQEPARFWTPWSGLSADQDTLLALLVFGGGIACALGAIHPMGPNAARGLEVMIAITNTLLALAIMIWHLGSRSWVQAGILLAMIIELTILIALTHSQIGLAIDLIAFPWISVYAACFLAPIVFVGYMGASTAMVLTASAFTSIVDPLNIAIRFTAPAWVAAFAIMLVMRGLVRRADTDNLTGILNRNGFFRHSNRAAAQRLERVTHLILIDLDDFKTVNDENGHLEGDRVLQDTATALDAALPAGSIVARIGGDEFAVLTFGQNDAGLHGTLSLLRTTLSCSFSYGLAPWLATWSLDEALAHVDRALYQDKRLRHGIVNIDSPARSSVLEPD